jgi:Transposase DDE domain
VNQTLFNTILRPLEAILASISPSIDQEADSEKLFFADFVRKLIFGYLYQNSSLRSLTLELKTNPVCRDLGLQPTPFSTLKDGFSRFKSKYFKQLYERVRESVNLSKVPFIEELGICQVIDGSLFPTLSSISWTNYREQKNAFKLHLSFELNRMMATEFWVGSGNSSERRFLEKVVTAGVTYIADRGYFSFALADKVLQAQAFLVMRVKDNLLYEVVESCLINLSEIPSCFQRVTDEIIIFTNDEKRNRLRLITFTIAGSYFRIVTNRFQLSTLKIIILYAYRWQIELFFKFMKRTMKGIHLLNHSQNGVEIQFYLLLTTAILMLKLKQSTQETEELEENVEEKREKKGLNPSEWIREIGKIFYKSWKISKNWLLIVKNSLNQIVDYELLKLLNGY